MSTRIYYRGPIIWNLILFVVFSFVFVYLQEIFKGFSSVTNRTYFLYFIKGHIPFVSILGLTLLMFLFQTPKLGKLGFFGKSRIQSRGREIDKLLEKIKLNKKQLGVIDITESIISDLAAN